MNTFQSRSHTSPVTKRTSLFGQYAALLGTCAVLSQTRLPAASLDLLQPAKEAAVQVIPSQKIEHTVSPQMTMSITHKDALAILGLG